MTKLSEIEAQRVFDLVQEIKKAQVQTVKGFLIIGRNLSLIQQDNLWAFYGTHIESFEDFLKELRFGRATVYNCMAIWREVGQMLISKNLDIGYFRLVQILPLLKAGADKEEWLAKAETLTIDGFKDEIRSARGLITTDECQHDGEKLLLEKCLVCGKIIRRVNE